MFTTDQVTPKQKTEIELGLRDGRVMMGNLFLTTGQRLIETLNDNRQFLPFEDSDGVFRVLNKSAISDIRPVVQKIERIKAVPRFMGPS